MKSEIGECVSVLYFKRWGQIRVGNKIRSRKWWEEKLSFLVNSGTIDLDPKFNPNPSCYDEQGNLMPPPIPFEQEIGWTEETSEYWLGWVQKAFRRRYER